MLPTDLITLDADLQSRVLIHEDVLAEYAHRLAEGATFPPVVVFFDGATHWLGDGYHRWHAHRAVGRVEIAVDVRQGSKRDALIHSLSANALHGRQRGGADLRKAYGAAVRHGLVAAVDVEGLARLLSCSAQWARELTREAREAVRAERDAAIVEQRAAGGSNREVARTVGVDEATVRRAAERKAFEAPQAPAPSTRIVVTHAPSHAWGQVLAALAAVANLPPVEDVLAQPNPVAEAQALRHLDAVIAWTGGFARRMAGAG